MKKNIFLNIAYKKILLKNYNENSNAMYDYACNRLQKIYEENKEEPKAYYRHTRNNIYPCIALLDTLIHYGIAKEDAVKMMSDFIDIQSESNANMIRKIMKIPFIYRLTPIIFGNMTKQNFGVKQNFSATYKEISFKRMRFDMTKCIYSDTFKKYNYASMTKAYCRADDIIYGSMHKKLKWKRTKTIGNKDECCDFHIEVIK